MSDPRASIIRTVHAPPIPGAAAQRATPAEVVEDVGLIGKPHGRMRCVNLSLTLEAREVLYARANADGVSLGEALMDLVAPASVRTRQCRPGRSAGMRRGVQTVSVFALLTPDEAREIKRRATEVGRSVSDFTSVAVTLTQKREGPTKSEH